MTLMTLVFLKVTLTTGLAVAGARLMRKSRAAARHVLLTAAFVMLLALPAASMLAPSFGVSLPIPVDVQDSSFLLPEEPLIETAVVPTGNSAVTVPPPASESWLPSASDALLALWAAGALLCLAPMIVGLMQMRALRRGGLPWTAGKSIVDGLARDAGIHRRVEVLLHESLPGPMTCGLLHPAIVLPADARAWSADDLQRAIVHELEHVRRADWLTHCLARVVSAVYWFHPLVWIARRQLELEAERACDDAVLASTSLSPGRDPSVVYADQLVTLAERLTHAPKTQLLAMANRNDLAARVRAVLDSRQQRGRAGAWMIVVACGAAALLVATISPMSLVAASAFAPAGASVDQQARFEAATIKPCGPEAEIPGGRARGGAGGTNAKISPGRFTVPCVTVEQLIYLAYASYGAKENEQLLNDYLGTASDDRKVRGGPAWVHSQKDKYEIEATGPGATDRFTLMGTMLRTLLEERFQLKIHRETEDAPMYALRVAKSGLKLKPMKEGDCDPALAATPPPWKGTPCGFMTNSSSDALSKWHYVSFPLSFLARQLAGKVGHHVIDETGVKGDFILDLTFSDEMGPSVFTALEEQMGLKLEKIDGKTEFIVIDRIERPRSDFAADAASSGPARAAGSGPFVPDKQKFEVASIKPCSGGGPSGPVPASAGRGAAPGSRSLNTITVNCQTLVEIISRAYMMFGNPPPLNIQNLFDPEKVTGGPDWARSDRYSIEAKADGTPGTQAMMGTMLRALLEERFQLKLHQELRDVRAYALTVAPGGLKVKPADPSTCDTIDPFAIAPAPAAGDKPRCNTSLVFNGPNLTLKATGQTFDRISKSMGAMLMDVVIDQTATTDLFTFNVEFVRDETITSLGPRTAQASDPPTAPTIFAAFEKQLGVKLAPTKAKQGYLVIDRAERPAPDFAAFAASSGKPRSQR
jgi:bla regulator protein BlaR1